MRGLLDLCYKIFPRPQHQTCLSKLIIIACVILLHKCGSSPVLLLIRAFSLLQPCPAYNKIAEPVACTFPYLLLLDIHFWVLTGHCQNVHTIKKTLYTGHKCTQGTHDKNRKNRMPLHYKHVSVSSTDVHQLIDISDLL